MFAIFEDGSHQYRVTTGDRLEIDFREAAKIGDSLQFNRVLAAGTDEPGLGATGQIGRPLIGRPLIDGASIQAEVVDDLFKAPKLEIGKFRRRKGYIRHNGHTQKYTQVRITAINVPGFARPVAQEAGSATHGQGT
jgi:large subunit ribosomal protein L21